MKSSSRTFALPAIVVDILTILAALFLLPSLTARMVAPGGWNALIISGAFFLFVIGVYLIRRLKPTSFGNSEWLSRGRRAGLALFFAFMLSLALAWQLGFFESAAQVDTTEMGEGGAASYFVFGPGAWLAFSLIYVLVFAFKVEPVIAYDDGRYLVAAFIGMIAAAMMLLVLAAQAQVIVMALGSGLGWAVLAFLVLATLFLPPRLLYLSRTTRLRSATATIVVAVLMVVLALITFLPLM